MRRHLRHEALGEGGKVDLKLLPRLLSFVKPYRRAVAVATVAALLTSLFGLASPYLYKIGIDRGIMVKDLRVLALVGLSYLGISAFSSLLSAVQMRIMGRMGMRIVYDMRRSVFSHTLRLPMRALQRFQTGDLLSRITNDIDAVQEAVTFSVVAALVDVITAVGCLVLMLKLSPFLSLIVLVLLPLLYLVTRAFRSAFRRVFKAVRERIAEVTTKLEETIAGVQVVQAFAQEPRMEREFYGVNFSNMAANLRAALIFGVFFPLVEFMGAGGNVAVYWLGGLKVVGGEITLGTLVAFSIYLSRFLEPINDLARLFNSFQAALAAAERIFSILSEEPEPPPLPAEVAPSPRGELAFDSVVFAYNGRPVLKEVTLHIPAGARVAVVGPTGAGKTTLANLAMRLYDPLEGAVYLDGRDMREIPPPNVRAGIGLVPQVPQLFHGTVADNIRMANPSMSDEEIKALFLELGLGDFLSRLPRGLETEVGEEGAKLSVGEKQLICFVRALARDPYLLILDEATASIDIHTEALIERALRRLLKGRTSLIIAHRLRTALKSDFIVVLNEGRVEAIGRHEDLIGRSPLYRCLVERQVLVA